MSYKKSLKLKVIITHKSRSKQFKVSAEGMTVLQGLNQIFPIIGRPPGIDNTDSAFPKNIFDYPDSGEILGIDGILLTGMHLQGCQVIIA